MFMVLQALPSCCYCWISQTSTNAAPLLIYVVPMLSVKILQGPTGVSVKLVLLEMDALVRMNDFPNCSVL